MKKQLSIVMISLSWVIGFMAVFAFSGTVEASENNRSHESVSSLVQFSSNQFNAGTELLEIPEFKIDWSLNAKLNPEWYVDLLTPGKVYLASSFFKKSVPLFDVKDTFIHFFYTW
ncbi:hypothetical protein J2X69_004319 [Algoriphagus sp. 4150]|uniref:hypothetical protein n=1 Tax=Algoriphagus sp. 4150 TaxID=2817756 RepID=UPI0028652CB7|nr:hypothetical protein [Algoriphagus sp. 4150]MDR7131953.1 hypothetical protein [Algoriphagus sp. 4150]